MKNRKLFFLSIVLIVIIAFCTKNVVSRNNQKEHNAEDNVQVITLDEENRVIYLNFAIAKMDQLNKYSVKEISTSRALSILDEEAYKKFPKEVQEELNKIKWNWSKGSIPSSGIIAY